MAGLDRYQASVGAQQAAEHVAARAEAVGLRDVEILRVPADGRRHWWTYAAPPSWTPTVAQLSVGGGRERRTVLRYPEQLCSVAVNSAPVAARALSSEGFSAEIPPTGSL